jgi:DNA-binding NarL/FixJ family response regulator
MMRSFEIDTDVDATSKPLTPKQLEVARLASRGLPNERIAGDLAITVGTVKLHLHQVYKKLGINTRVELVMRADELIVR